MELFVIEEGKVVRRAGVEGRGNRDIGFRFFNFFFYS